MHDLISFSILLILFALLAFVAYRIVRDAPGKAELQRLRGVEEEARKTATRLESKTQEFENLKIRFARLESDFENGQ